MTLVFLQCAVNTVCAALVILVTGQRETTAVAPSKFFIMSACYIFAMFTSSTALLYVNYPTQVLAKSCKPIPVMLLGVLFAKKRYDIGKYVSVLLIVIGITIFMFKDQAHHRADYYEHYWFGLGLLCASLAMDGFTGVFQERLMAGATRPKAHFMMLYMNFWATLILLAGLVYNQEWVGALDFCQRHRAIINDMVIFSCFSAVGQNFIFLTVNNFGPLTCSIITTTRKFFTILGSVFIFGHILIPRQWLGVLIVFSGLFLDAYLGSKRKSTAVPTPSSDDSKKLK
eukprot:Nk52_evm1s23 gene=Nk52_evmTU1s23